MGSKRRKSGRRFIRFWTNVKRSNAYHNLSLAGRCTLVELMDRYNGINNGMISMSVRELADRLNCHHATAARALRELDDAGLARPTTLGAWRGRRAAEWRLTFHRCDKTGELPVSNWASACVAPPPAKVAPEPHKPTLCRMGAARKPKSSMNDPVERVSGATHIDIYQGGRELVTRSEGATPRPSAEPVKQAPNNFGPSEARIRALDRWGANAKRKPWTKPTILYDELRDFSELPIETGAAA